MSTANQKNGVGLKFPGDFSCYQYELFEVDEELLTQLLDKKGQILIKGYEVDGSRTSRAISEGRTHKLKLLENSNQMLVANLEQGSVLKQTHTFIELESTRPNLYQLVHLLKSRPGVIASPKDGGVTMEEMLESCQVSRGELEQLLSSEEQLIRFHLFSRGEGEEKKWLFFEPEALYELIDSLLIFLNAQASLDLNNLTAKAVLEQNDGIIKEKFWDEKIIGFALKHLCDYEKGSEQFRISHCKILKSVALAMLQVKESYMLKEFIQALKHALDLAIPLESIQQDSPSAPSENLFEGFSEFDLSVLKGLAIVIPQREVVTCNDDLIMMADPYFQRQLEDCGGRAEKRLETLFQIKQKWTQQELQYQLEDFIELGMSLETYLMKNCKILREKNPFNPSKDITYYLKKF